MKKIFIFILLLPSLLLAQIPGNPDANGVITPGPPYEATGIVGGGEMTLQLQYIDEVADSLKTRDASGYGFLPSATASDNVSAIQDAFDAGGIITVITPGTYDLNATVYIGSNTFLMCSPGVIFRKTGDYGNVILNKGALTKVYDTNIVINGLTLSVNGVDTIDDLDVEGLRGQIAFYYVEYLVFENFKCLDVALVQFCVSISNWRYVNFKNLHIEGEKDGVNMGVGHDGLIENLYCKTQDDAFKLYTVDFSTVMVETGDIYNVTVRNLTDANKDSPAGYTIRLLYGSWADWLNGNSYKKSDMAVNAGNLYIVMLSDSGFPVNGTAAPVHGSGSVKGADGITWRYLQACDFYHGDIYNITFDNIISNTKRITLNAFWIDSDDMRAVYPGTETLSSTYNLKFINSTIKDTETWFTQFNSNMRDLTISNCTFDNITRLIACSEGYDNFLDDMNVTVTGCIFKNITTLILILQRSDGRLIDVSMAGNRYESVTTFDLSKRVAGSQIRLINMDLPISTADMDTLTAVIGDICRGPDGLYIYKAGGWVNLAL